MYPTLPSTEESTNSPLSYSVLGGVDEGRTRIPFSKSSATPKITKHPTVIAKPNAVRISAPGSTANNAVNATCYHMHSTDTRKSATSKLYPVINVSAWQHKPGNQQQNNSAGNG